MAVGSLSYKDWLAKSGRRSSKASAGAWAKWAGKPGPKGKPAADPRRRGAGPTTPPYMGYAGAVDPAFGGTPFGVPADSQVAWTGTSNPDLAEIARGGFGNLTPRKRAGGGWDVYGTPTDPTPQWGKDYLTNLQQRQTGHQQYAEKTIAPWLGQVLGAANQTNAQAQTGLANLMASVNTNMTNAAQGGAAPMGMAGAGAAPGAHQAIAQQQGLQAQAGAQTFGGAYQAALGQTQVGSAAQAQEAAFAQSRLKLPTQYEQMRMEFTKQLGEVTEGIKENQRAREFQRQQLLEQRREFGLEFKEKVRSTRAQERAEAEALGFEVAKTAQEGQDAAAEAENQTYADIKSSIDPGQEELVDNKGKGWANRPNIARFHGKPVTWQQATNGKWYGIAGKDDTAGDGASPAGEKNKDYMKRWREYSGSLSDKLYGPVVKDPNDPAGGSRRDTAAKMSWTDVIDDVFNVQRFRPEEAWSMLKPHIKKLGPSRKRIEQSVVRRMAQSMRGQSRQNVLNKIQKVTGIERNELYAILGFNPNAGAV